MRRKAQCKDLIILFPKKEVTFQRNLRPYKVLKHFDKTCEDITNIGLEKSRRMTWSCYNFEYTNPHWTSRFQRENQF